MTRALAALWLLFVLLAGCQPELVPAKTQVTVRVHSSDQRLLDALKSVRFSLFRSDEAGWVQRGGSTVPVDTLRWPLDVPVTPSSEATVDREFEVIVEGWSADARLAQTRAVTKFVAGSVRMIEVWLGGCGDRELGYVCGDADCHGESCTACDSSGDCTSVGFRPAETIYDTSEQPVVKPAPMTVVDFDAGTDAEVVVDAESAPVVDSAVPPAEEAAVMMPLTCAPACPTTADCVTSSGAPHCVCHAGYQEVAGTCEDLDECKLGTHGCSEHATCRNIVGGHECECQENFNDVKGDGTQCVDKCQGACDAHAACTVLDGKVNCQCSGAYTGDGKTCMLNPSCEMLNCGANSQCTLKAGTTNSYQCSCLTGYQLVAGKCEDINECQLTPPTCGTGASCTNTPGSRTCACLTGYTKNAVTGACENADDCKQKPCLNGGVCSDLVNDFSCECTGTGFTGKQCQTNTPDCPTNACAGGACVDGVKDYSCTCGTGYRVATGGKACDIINCGPLGNPSNGSVATPNGTTYNQTATYSCASGFKLSGTATRTCGTSGAWGGTAPTCGQVLCTTLSDPNNGVVSVPSRAVGQIATYTCNSGYGIASGNASRTCVDDGTGTGVWSGTVPTCALACTINDSCRPGDACVNNPDCGSGNVCSAGRCLLGSCGGGTVASATDVQNLLYCNQINGDLTIQVSPSGPAQIELPNTTAVLGNLLINGSAVNVTRTVTLSALTSVTGTLHVGPAGGGTTAGLSKLSVSLPALARVDNTVNIQLAQVLSSLNLAALSTIGGALYLEYLDNLQTLRLDSLRSVTGEIYVLLLPNIGYSPVFTRLASSSVSSGGTKSFFGVGCCVDGNWGPDCADRGGKPTSGCL